MFHISSANARQCYERAVIARDRAVRANGESGRHLWSKLEHGWLTLGQSYEVAYRLQIALVVGGFAFAGGVVLAKMVAG